MSPFLNKILWLISAKKEFPYFYGNKTFKGVIIWQKTQKSLNSKFMLKRQEVKSTL